MNQYRSLQPFNKPDERHKKRECTTEYTLFFIYIIMNKTKPYYTNQRT